MKPLEEVVGRVVPMRRPTPLAKLGSPSLPALPPELASAADLIAGAVRFGDMVLSQPEARFHPDAGRYAAAIGAALDPAPPELVRAWFNDLAKSLVPGPIPASVLFHALLEDCGDMPALCWSPETRRAVRRKHEFLPSIADLTKILDAEARKWRGRAAAFDSMAKAKREPEQDWREREAPAPADMPPPTSERPTFDPAKQQAISDANQRAQLAALGVKAGATELLAARRKALGQ